MIKFKIGKLYYVEWDDSFRPVGTVWKLWGEGADETSVCKSLGWCTGVSKRYVQISGHVSSGNETTAYCTGTLFIPLAAFVRIKEIKTTAIPRN